MMRIVNLTLKNFRCFGDVSTTISLDNLTAFIGANGSGKTAVLQGLSKLFGITKEERTIQRDDFHLSNGMKIDDVGSLSLYIEAILEFPELANGATCGTAVPECFRYMLVSKPDGTPFCRIRLEATWTPGNTPEGDIEENIYWIRTANDEVAEDKKTRMPVHDRSRIHVLYIPATRDPNRELRSASGALVWQLLKSIVWSDDIKDTIADAFSTINGAIQDEEGLKLVQATIKEKWSHLHDLPIYAEPCLQPGTGRLDDTIRSLSMVFRPSEQGDVCSLDRLSDGLKSLFHLAIACAAFEIGDELLATCFAEGDQVAEEGIRACILRDKLNPPSLTIFAIEEPENHLAPQYLGRIMEMFGNIAQRPSAQVVLSSHSPSVMSRVDPPAVRYFRYNHATCASSVKSLTLPEARDVAYKYVKEAVRAYPELYFARMVVLCEGDSEEIILPRMLGCLSPEMDTSFLSIVPLGGRHVNHFWRLLNELSIPYLTLLDLDRERKTGGWERIHYVLTQLLKIGKDRNKLLMVECKEGDSRVLNDTEFADMARSNDVDNLTIFEGWLDCLQNYNVFFASPIDIDFLMLQAYPDCYKAIAPINGGPQIPTDVNEYQKRIDRAVNVVLKDEGGNGDSYTDAEKALFPWYSYLFLGKGKPSTHILALSAIEDETLRESIPEVFRDITEYVKQTLKI